MKSSNSQSVFRNSAILILCLISLMALVGYGAFTASSSTASIESVSEQTDKAQKKAPLPQAPHAQATGVPNAPSAVTVTATKTDNVTPNTTKILPGSTINYTVAINSTGTTDAAAVAFNDVIDPNTALVAGSVHASPVAVNETHNWVGNTFLDTSARGLPSVLANDTISSSPDTIVLTTLTNADTTLLGKVTLAANGHFTYTPPLGRPNIADGASVNDSFNYTVKNSADATLSATGTVTINLSGRVWYLQAGAAGDGRSGTPSGSPSAMSTAADKSTDIFYIFANAGSLNGLFTVDAGQQLLGQGVNLVVNSITLFTAAAPTPTTTNGAGNGVTLAGAPGNNTLSGFNIGNCSGTAILGANVGTLTISTMTINTTGAGLDLTGVSTPTVNVVLSSLTSSGGAKNVNLVGLNGTVNLGGGALSAATGNAFDVSGAGTANITFTGTISNSATNARVVSIVSKTGGTVALSGNITQNTGTNPGGIFLNSNTGATINLTGTLALSTGTNAAFTATGGGTVASTKTDGTASYIKVTNVGSGYTSAPTVSFTGGGGSGAAATAVVFNGKVVAVNVTSAGSGYTSPPAISFGGPGSGASASSLLGGLSTITTTTGTAMNVANTTIGSGGLLFRSIAANGAASGILLNNTGASGGLSVTGDGAASNNGSGGTIQNTTGVGISLTTTQNVHLGHINLLTSGDDGIRGQGVTNFTLDRCNLTNNGNATAENGIQFGEASGSVAGLFGTAAITNTAVSGSAGNNLHLRNVASTLDSFVVTGSSFNNLNDATGANSFLFEITDTATLTTGTLTSCTFQNNSPQRGLEVQVHNSGTITKFTVQNSAFIDNGIQASFTQDANLAGNTANMDFNFLDNGTATSPGGGPMITCTLQAINVFSSSNTLAGFIKGRIERNVIGNPAVAGSGSSGGSGIRILIQGKTTGTFNIDGNTIRQVGFTNGGRGMDLQFLGPLTAAQPPTQSDLTITNNFVQTDAPGATFPLAAIFLGADNQGSPAQVRADIRTNTVPVTGTFDYPTFDGNAPQLVYVNVTAGAIAQLVDNPPASANAAAELASHNTGNTGTSGTVNLIAGPITLPPPSAPDIIKESTDDSSSSLTSQSIETGDGRNIEPAITVAKDSRSNVVGDLTAIAVLEGEELYQQRWVSYVDLQNNNLGFLQPFRPLKRNFDTAFAVFNGSDASRANLSFVNYPIIAAAQKTSPNVPQTTVTQNIPVLPAGKSVTIKFAVTVNNPPAAAQVSNQGTVSGSNFSSVLTDDPDTGTAGDPTVTLIDLTITWAGGTSTNWDTGSNWNTTFAPVAVNDVVIPAAGVTNEPTISASSPSVTSLTIATGRTLTITGQTLNIAGNWTNNGALAGDGTVVFNGNGNTQTLAGSTTFNNLTINHTGAGNVTATGSTLTVSNLMRVQAGTFISSSTFKDVLIDSGATLQQTAATTMNVSGNWTNNGTFTASTGTVNFNGSAAQTISGSSTTTFNILTDANTAAPLAVSTNANAGGALTVNANAILAPAAAVIIGGGGTLTGNGTAQVTRTAATADFSSQYTITNKTLTNLTVEYIGGAAQTCSALTYGNLKINNSSGVTLGGNATVNLVLTLMSGNVDAGANTLSIAAGGSINRTSGYVLGNLKKTFAATSPFTYPVGTANAFSPVNVTVTAGTGDLTVKGVQGPQPLVNASKSLQRYWTLSGTGITADLVFQYLVGDVMGNESVYRVIRVSGSTVFAFQNSPPNVFVDPAAHTMNIQHVSAFSDWTAGELVAPTAVELESIAATGYDGGTFIEWRTGSEVSNLGFNIYRDEGGKRVPINPQIVAGSALVAGSGTRLSAGRSYSWWDNRIADGGNVQYWIEDIDLNGNRTLHGPVSVRHIGGAPIDRSSAAMLSQVGIAQSGVTRAVAIIAPLAVARPDQISIINSLAGQAAVKLAIKREGFYRVTGTDLFAAGLDPKADPERLQLYADGKQVPIKVATDKQGLVTAVEFYGVGLDTVSTDARVYWLIAGSQAGLRIARVKGSGFATAASSFLSTVERKDRTIYFPALRNGERENFFGAVVAGEPVDQSLALPGVDSATSAQATIEVALQGVTNLQHRVWAYVNGSFAGELLFDGQAQGQAKLLVSQSQLREGDNTVRLVAQGGPSDISLMDYIRVSYWHGFAADDNALRLTVTGGQATTVTGFTSAAVRVFDVTDPDRVEELTAKVEQQEVGYSATFASPRSGERRLLAIADERADKPAGFAANRTSNLRGTNHAADLVIITRRDFSAAFDTLARLRASQGIKTEIVEIEDIYDEFSFGNKSPQAVKDFLQYAKANWKTGPRFVLLAGDSSYDPKNYLGLGDWDIAPAKLIDTGLMETASDDWFADFDNDGLAELAVGRLPVRTADEATAMVAKIVSYESSNRSEEVLLVADVSDTFDFEGANTQLRALIPPNLRVNEIDRGRVDAMTARSQLVEAINRGQKVVNYLGHGSVNLWRGGLLTSEDASLFENITHPSLFIMMTCLNGYSHEPVLDSLAEALMKARGGAIAVWASSGMTVPDGQTTINQEMYRLIFNSGALMTLGEATNKAKATVSDADVRRTWILFGDPTMRLR